MSGKILKRSKKDPVYKRAGIIAAASVLCFAGVFLWDNLRQIETNETGQKILQRNPQGQGDSSAQLRASIGENEEEFSVTVSEQEYTEEELDAVFQEASEDLEKLILGENESLDEVRDDLELISEIPETGISVSWEIDNYEVMDLQGNLISENLTDDGTLVKLSASLLYGERQAVHEFYAKVYPTMISRAERQMSDLKEEIARADEETASEDHLVLPDQINGERVEWSYTADTRAFAILILGAGTAAMICVSKDQSGKEEEKRRIRQMKTDYPQIINKFNLYIGAGMTIRRAWSCIVDDYEKKRERYGKRVAYEEMIYTLHEIQGGAPEGECYEKYGNRCGISRYRKFGTMLSQNLRKGSRGITDLLEREAEEAFEDRKNMAKKLGEEAGTKLMIPMFIMLAVVFVIVTVPAFFSIQI